MDEAVVVDFPSEYEVEISEIDEGEDFDLVDEAEVDEAPAPSGTKRGTPRKHPCHIVNCAKTFQSLKTYTNHLKLHLVEGEHIIHNLFSFFICLCYPNLH